MTNHVSAREIQALRHAQRVTVTETDGTAVLTCHLTRLLPVRPLLASFTVPVASTELDLDLGASPWRGGDTTLALIVRHARRNPNWAAFINTVRDGDQLEVQWERNGYALLLVRSHGEVEDKFCFPTTRRTRRLLRASQSQAPRRAARLLTALTEIAGRVPVPVRGRTADTSALTIPAAEAAQVPVAAGDDR